MRSVPAPVQCRARGYNRRTPEAHYKHPGRPCLPTRRPRVKSLMALSALIDRASERVGHTIYWLVLVTVVISAANAVVRKAFNWSSNSLLEIQWYLFSMIFLFCAGYTL